ncbi:MAG: hypothetical protein JWP12_2020 [Bacteroidetes bacterium]|nr:hypothetical protein [Bacteroidota bacterium]
MRILIKVIFLAFLLTFSLKVYSVNNDTTSLNKPKNTTKFFYTKQFEYQDSVNLIDNSLYDFQKYVSRNILGNNGLAIHDISYNPFQPDLGFNYCKNNYSAYFYNPHQLKFYNTRTPYTDLLYVMGTKGEQNFKMTFSYNVKKNWNITADFFRLRSTGVYERQTTFENYIALSTNYKSKNNRYWLLGSVIYNGEKNQENGGIKEDSTFDSGKSIDQQLLRMNLSYATRSQVNRNVYLKQIINLGKKSTDTSDTKVIIPESRFILSSTYDDNYLRFEDSQSDMLSGYYSNLYYDSTQTADSTYFRKIENELEWKRLDNNKHRGLVDLLGVGFSVKHQLVFIRQKDIDTVFNNIIAGVQFYNTYSKHAFWWNLSGNYVASGYNKNDYQGVFVFRKKLADSLLDVTVKGESRSQTADFIYSQYRSNNFIWNNNFEKMQQSGAEISFKISKYHLDVIGAVNSYTNVLYFDNYAVPRQYTGTLPVFSVILKKDFILWNWHLNNRITYQKTPELSVIRLPELVLEHSLYYENDLIHKALRLQVGASVYYSTAYYADAYMPVTGEFYLQSQRKYGDYPFIDFFINAKIKTVRIFFKIDHLNSGLNSGSYILTPGYPYPGRTFKLGLSWKFYD